MIAVVIVLVAGVLTGVQRYRYRFVRSDQDLLRLLPGRADASLLFADLDALRQAGYLSVLEGAEPKQEQQYTGFVRETGFDYMKDLRAVAGEMADAQLWFALRGRFQWRKIRDYIGGHGGNCSSHSCVTGTSTPGRAVTFRAIQPDVMTLEVGASAARASELTRARQNSSPFVFDAPVWVKPSRALLMDPVSLPIALRIFAISLQSADTVVLALERSEAEDTSFAITINALFRNEPTAQTAKNQLEIDTRMLKTELMRERRQPLPGDLSWLLVSGTFQTSDRQLHGAWPVRKELIRSLR